MPASLSSIPYHRGMPILGIVPEIRRDALAFFRKLNDHGPMARGNIGPLPMVFALSPETVQQVLVDDADVFEKSRLMKAAGILVGNGLLVSDNAFHRRQRKLVAPAFQHRRVIGYADLMVDYTRQMLDGWRSGDEIVVGDAMMALTFRIVGKTLFDVELAGGAATVGDIFSETLRDFQATIETFPPIPYSWPIPRNRRLRRNIARLDALVLRIIAERRASGDDRGDLLSMLLASHDEDDGSFMTDAQLRDETMTLLLAGHETTATTLTWVLLFLADSPAWRRRVEDEVDRVLGTRPATFADLAALPVTTAVVKETLRLRPAAYVFSREPTRPVEVGGVLLPAGTIVTVSPYATHHRTDLFPDPERFDPDRWLGEVDLPKMAYFPFGSGPRVCIGNQFAMMEAQLVLATICQATTIDLAPGERLIPDPAVALRVKGGGRALVRRRALVAA